MSLIATAVLALAVQTEPPASRPDVPSNTPADLNGDGRTTPAEFAAYAGERLRTNDADELAAIAKRVDADGDGIISESEFDNRMQAIGGAGGAQPDAGAAGDSGTLHRRPIVERDGQTLLWARDTDDDEPEWFDMTASTIDPRRFEHGIGKDTIMSIDRPHYVHPDAPIARERGINDDTMVLGVAMHGEARAYPVSLMSRCEVVNDVFADEPYAVLW